MIRISYEDYLPSDTLRYTKFMVLEGELVRGIIDMRGLRFSIVKQDHTVIEQSESYSTLDKCKRELRHTLIDLGVVLYDEVRGSDY